MSIAIIGVIACMGLFFKLVVKDCLAVYRVYHKDTIK